MGGTLAAVIGLATALFKPRGTVRTTWLGGSAVPFFRLAYIMSIAWMK